MVGLEKTSCLIHRCAIYELLYLNGATAAPENLENSLEATAASENLENSMLSLYTAILKFLARAIERSKVEYSRRTRLSPPLIISQITASRRYSQRERLPSTSRMSRTWKKRSNGMPPSPKPIVLSGHTVKVRAMLTLWRYTGRVRELAKAAGRYQHVDIPSWATNRWHSAKTRRYQSSPKISRNWNSHTVSRVQEVRDPGMDIHHPVYESPQADQ